MGYETPKQKHPTVRFWIVTLFPEVVEPYATVSIIGRAVGANAIQVYLVNPRDFAKDKHKTVDERPYGGGPGMVMTAEPLLRACEKIRREIDRRDGSKVLTLVTSPGGVHFTNEYAQAVIDDEYSDVVILCGRYEGIDARVAEILRAHPISIGNYVMTGGELAALVMIDVITRRIPGVLGKFESLEEERISSHEMYTRPAVLEWNGKQYKVPDVLMSGNHGAMEQWKLDSK